MRLSRYASGSHSLPDKELKVDCSVDTGGKGKERGFGLGTKRETWCMTCEVTAGRYMKVDGSKLNLKICLMDLTQGKCIPNWGEETV